jgi:hypothetical protein
VKYEVTGLTADSAKCLLQDLLEKLVAGGLVFQVFEADGRVRFTISAI